MPITPQAFDKYCSVDDCDERVVTVESTELRRKREELQLAGITYPRRKAGVGEWEGLS